MKKNIFTLCAVLLPLVGQAAENYTVTDLGILPGYQYSRAAGINNSGQVVVQSLTTTMSTSIAHSFIYSHGEVQDLGTLGGQTTYASDVNDSGVIVGTTENSSGNFVAFTYSNGTMTALPIDTEFNYGSASKIANSGYVAGSSGGGFLFINGSTKTLAGLGGSGSDAEGVNDSGVVVGWAPGPDNYPLAFVYSGGPVDEYGDYGNKSQ